MMVRYVILATSAIALAGCTSLPPSTVPPAPVFAQGDIRKTEAEYMTRQIVLFTCGRWEDSNENGIHDFPAEFKDIKRTFRINEDMVLVGILQAPQLTGKRWTVKIYGPRNREIENCGDVFPSNRVVVHMGSGRDENLSGWLASLGGPGQYSALLYVNETLESMCEFNILRTAAVGTEAVHTIQRGETLSSIARRFGTTPKTLARLNKLRDLNRIRAGDRLIIPAPPKPTAKPRLTSRSE